MVTRILRANRRSLLAALLAALLLPVVTGAHAHVGEHHDALHGDLGAEACLVCQVGSGKTGVLPPQQMTFPEAGWNAFAVSGVQPDHPRAVRAMPFLVRGPPA